MENEACSRCGRSSEQVKLVDTIDGNELMKICEECALTEDAPIIRKPTTEQIKISEQPYSIRRRLSNMAGLDKNFKPGVKTTDYSKNITLDKLRKPRDYKAILDSRFEAAKKRNQPLNLIDNFNWHITMARKNRKITRKQLADTIGESETSLRMIEENFLPDDASRVINKIEQYFGMNLRKGSNGIFSKIVQDKETEKPSPAVVLKFDPNNKNITIEDLRKMKQAREGISETEKEIKKEINISELIWKAKSEEKPIKQEKKEEIQETFEEKKSRKSFFDFFKFGKKKQESAEIPEKSIEFYDG